MCDDGARDDVLGVDAIGAAHDVDVTRRNAQIRDFLGFQAAHVRDDARGRAELSERVGGAIEIRRLARDEHVEILRRARPRVVTHGIASQHDESHLSGDELRQLLSEVGVEVHRAREG